MGWKQTQRSGDKENKLISTSTTASFNFATVLCSVARAGFLFHGHLVVSAEAPHFSARRLTDSALTCDVRPHLWDSLEAWSTAG